MAQNLFATYCSIPMQSNMHPPVTFEEPVMSALQNLYMLNFLLSEPALEEAVADELLIPPPMSTVCTPKCFRW